MDSIWLADYEENHRKELINGTRADVVVIGGGMAGLLCAYRLQEAGANCVVLEADRVFSGVSKNTTAKITCQHGLIYDNLIRRFGLETARDYYLAQQAALNSYKNLCESIPCDFEEKPLTLYSCANRKVLEDEAVALEQIGCPVRLQNELPLPMETKGGVVVDGQAQFHPVKFVSHITKGMNIYEKTRVLEMKPGCVSTNKGEVYAEKIIVATHFPFLNKHGMYFMKMYQDRSYVLTLKNTQNLCGMFIDADSKGITFRNYEDMLLLGGGSHRTGKTGGCWQELMDFAHRHYPQAEIVAKWATQDCMTLDGIPYIGQYSKMTPDLFVATGFNKWGMTSSMAASTILCDLVQGKENDYAYVFDPSRSMLHPQLAANLFESFKGILTPTAPRCPHMGCVLKYNKAEHSWDCTCHGSRFTKDGRLIDNPATGDKKSG